MNVFTFTNFSGHYPVGTAAVVVAHDLIEAKRLLGEQLAASDLPALDGQVDVNISRVDLEEQQAIILLNGNY